MSKIVIGLPDQDAKQASLDQQVINSLYPSPKINAEVFPPHAGLIDLSWSETTEAPLRGSVRTLYSFPHGYNYVPTVLSNFILDFLDGSPPFASMLPLLIGIGGDSSVLILMDADLININLKVLGLFATTTIPGPFKMKIRFYVFAERGKE